MREKAVVLMLNFVFILIATDVFALTVTAESVSSGTYEDGKFTPRRDSFKAKYTIDEKNGTVRLEEVIENNREERVKEGAVYEITNTVVSKGISALLVSRDKKGQRIITAVREADIGASEIIIFGNDFYEYCRASNGRFYLEYGKISRTGQ